MVNGKIAEILCSYHGWVAAAERSCRIVGDMRMTPDIIVEAHRNAVVIETEFHPAGDVENDVDRLANKELRGIGKITSVIGVNIPKEVQDLEGDDLVESLKNISFGYFIKDENGRFPETGYLKGTIWDISAAITLTSIPWSSIKYCVGQMEESIDMMSASISKVDNAIMKDISINLGDSHDNVPEMASLMLLNAGIFYEEIAAHHPKIKPLSTISVLRNIPQESLINAWCEVLKIDYSPIFEVAVEIVKALPSEIASDVLSIMHGAVSKIAALHMTKSGDVYGKLYQTMIGRRKNIAAFYTKPIAAALLTGLVMPHSSDELWKNQDDLKKLRIADFACGSGMLLTHAYYHIKHCMNGDAGKLHAHLMENCFYGYDIMPTATHLTVSNLAGIYPDVFFKMTNIYTLPIGKSDHGYYLGSFDLLRDTVKFANAGLRHGGSGSKNVDAATI